MDGPLLGGLLLAGVLAESQLQLLDRLAAEAGQAGVQHQLEMEKWIFDVLGFVSDLDEVDEGVAVGPDGEEGLDPAQQRRAVPHPAVSRPVLPAAEPAAGRPQPPVLSGHHLEPGPGAELNC